MSAYPEEAVYSGPADSAADAALGECSIVWKSLSSIKVQNSLGNEACWEVEKNILAIPLCDLIQHSRMQQAMGWNEDERSQRYHKILQVASISIHHYLNKKKSHEEVIDLEIIQTDKSVGFKSVMQVWVEDSDILHIINAFFDEGRETFAEQKELALDLGFVLASHLLNFTDPSFGFVAPISKWQQQLLLITTKLLESFMVTTPPHFPFMPAQYFTTIRWPVVVRESCSGKVHSIVTFAPAFDDDCSTGEGSPEKKEDVKYCNYEVVNRRQPWKNKFSALQLYQLALVVMESKTISTTMHHQDGALSEKATDMQNASAEGCEAVLSVLRNVVQRIAAVDPALLYRDKTKSVVYKEASTCNLCEQAVSSLLGRLNPFSLFGSAQSSTSGINNNATTNCAASVASTDTTSSTGTSLFGFANSTKPAHSSATVKVTAGIAESAPHARNSTSTSTGPLAKHHCRLCLETVCPSCCAPEPWMNDRVCVACYSVVQEMGLRDLKPKKKSKRGYFGTSTSTSEGEATSTSLSPQEQLVLSILKGEPGNTVLGDPVYSDKELALDDDDDANEGRITRCCSEMMPASLRVWRDGQDDLF